MIAGLIIGFAAGFVVGGYAVGKFMSNKLVRELEKAKKAFKL